MKFCRKTILLLIFSSFMSVGWGQDCIDGVEVELWDECYSIENTTEILLPSSELTGEIPESIGVLINLNSLVLYNNQLSGEIPESIENLTNLTWLNLYNNQLTGEIPESIGNLTNLTSLDLGFNQFSGEIPESFGNLTNLNYLWLYHNQLNGEIPITICNIDQNLEHFYIYENQLCPPYPECLTKEDIGYQDTSECEGCCYEEFLAYENCDGDGCFIPQCTENCEWEPMQCWGSTGYCWCVDENGIEIEGTSQPSWEGFPDCEEIDLGDINDDDSVDVLDVVMLVNYILSGDTSELDSADINNDNEVNILDVVQLVNIILGVNENTVTDIDGNVYETVQIGGQLWMAKNLIVTHYNNGDEIPTGYSASEWDAIWDDAYAVYDDNPSNADIYGNLYNWFAVDDSRGICPENYHIPTDDEWYILLEYLGGAPSGSGENWILAGGKMKDVGTIEDGDGLWYSPNEGATNESGFTAIPAGFRLYDGQYYESGYYSIYWSSTAEYYSDAFFMWYLLHDNSRLFRGLFDSQTGLSVRCLKN